MSRYRLVIDDAAHWYVIPVDKEKDFDAWVEAREYGLETDFDFTDCMVNPLQVTFPSYEV